MKKTGSSVKQYFERRARRQGLQVIYNNNNSRQEQYFNRFKGLPFWIADRQKHSDTFDRVLAKRYSPNGSDKVACCFWHAIGLPSKHGESKPLFGYEQEIFNALQVHKHLWVKKATGLGLTEFMLRYIAWRCLKDDEWKNKEVCILTGPRIECY